MHHRQPGAFAAAALALAVLTACSGSPANRPAAADGSAAPAGTDLGTSASPAASPLGVIDTDPADPPVLNPKFVPGKPAPSGFRGEPTALRPPASWDPAQWLAQVHDAAGSTVKPSDNEGALSITTAWLWSTTGIKTLSAGVISDGQNHPLKVSCSAEGFDAADAAAAAEITRTLELCARTGLSGDAAAAAQSWIGSQIPPLLADIRTGFTGTAAVSASPSFGGTTYQVAATYQFQDGYLIQVAVW